MIIRIRFRIQNWGVSALFNLHLNLISRFQNSSTSTPINAHFLVQSSIRGAIRIRFGIPNCGVSSQLCLHFRLVSRFQDKFTSAIITSSGSVPLTCSPSISISLLLRVSASEESSGPVLHSQQSFCCIVIRIRLRPTYGILLCKWCKTWWPCHSCYINGHGHHIIWVWFNLKISLKISWPSSFGSASTCVPIKLYLSTDVATLCIEETLMSS